jgi:WD40 repeat protein
MNMVRSVSFSADGRRIYTADEDGVLKVWETTPRSDRVLMRGRAGRLRRAACDPHGLRFAGLWELEGGAKEVRVWDRTGQVLFSTRAELPGSISQVHLSPTGEHLIVSAYELARTDVKAKTPGQLRVWELATGREVFQRTTDPGHAFFGLAISPDGRRLATAHAEQPANAQARSVRTSVWDLTTGQELLAFDGIAQTFSLDGRHLALRIPNWASPPQREGELLVRDLATGEVVFSRKGLFGHPPYDPTGKYLAVSSISGAVSVLDAVTGQLRAGPLSGHRELVHGMVFSPDGARLFTSDGEEIKVWDAVSGREVLALKTSSGSRYRGDLLGMSADGHRLFALETERMTTWSLDVAVRTWDATPLPDDGPAKEGNR